MALVVKDRVKETTTTTGTGTITLAGAVDGFQSFSAALSDGDTTYYAISETSTGEWEVGLGTFTATGTTLARTTILASSNSGSAVSLTSEADVFITQPAGKSVFFDGSGDLTLNQDPTSALHAATKEYVDTIAAAGLHYHDPVRVEQEGNLSATYDNGTAGVGATLTNNSTQAALSIDGVTLSLNDRVLIYEQTNAFENGVYTVTDTGSASTNWVLTRATDADSYAPSDPDSLGQGDAFFVLEGNAGAGELYVMNTEGTITFGTTGITFTQVAATAVFTAGDGLTLTGTTFAVGAGTGVTVNANDIAIGQAVGTSDSPTFAGMTTTADITFGTNDKASFGTTLDVYSDGTDSYVVESGTGNLYIDSADLSIRNAAGTATMASFDDTGSVTLNHNNSTKFTTQSYGIDVTGNVQADGLVLAGDATFGDNDKAIFGAGSDLQIYSDGTTGQIVGNVNVTGTLTSDGLTVDSGSGANQITLARSTTYSGISWSTLISDFGGGGSDLIFDSTGASTGYGFRTRDSGDVLGKALVISPNRDISFYDSLGSSQSFFWDASTESLGIGTSSPAAELHVYGSTTVARLEGNSTGVYLNFKDTGGDTVFIGAVGDNAYFETNGSERMRIDSSGNVGIGGFAPETWSLGKALHVGNAENALWGEGDYAFHMVQNAYYNGGWKYTHSDEASLYTIGDGTHVWYNAASGTADAALSWSEAMRIDSSGNLLVGTTSTSLYNNSADNYGFVIGNSGTYQQSANNTVLAYFNRQNGDGEIMQFRKDGTTVGSIGSQGGDSLTVGNGDTGLLFTGANDAVHPWNTSTNASRDGAIDLGRSSQRFKDLYLSGAAYTHSIAKQTTAPIVINSTLSSSKALRVYYDMDIYNTINFTDASWANQGYIVGSSGNLNLVATNGVNGVQISNNTVWHAGNDGSGSGLDADLWDGNQFSSYLNQALLTTSNVTHNRLSATDYIYANNAYIAGSIVHNGDADTYISFGTDTITLATAGSSEITVNSTGVRLGDTGNGYFQPVSGEFGSIQIDGGAHGGWEGYSIGGQFVFMTDGSNTGIYNDIDNEWMWYAQRNGSSYMYHDGTAKLITSSGGVTITGTCSATSFSGDGSGLTGLPAATGISTASSVTIEATGSGSDITLDANDDVVIYFGAQNMYFDAGASEVRLSCRMEATEFEATSDINLKENIELLTDPLGKLSGISGYSYNFKGTGKASYGVIAQEVEEVLPDAVSTNAVGTKSVNYNAIVALLVETIKEQEKRIAALEEKVGV